MTFSSCTKKFTAIPPILQNAEVVLVRALDLANGRIPRSPVLSKYFAPPISDPPELHHEFGDQQLLCRGFLLPSLSELGPNSKVISAPSARESFINVNSASSISDLIENKDEGSTAVGIYFYPRVDLDLSHPCTTNPEVLLHPYYLNHIGFLRTLRSLYRVPKHSLKLSHCVFLPTLIFY